MEKIKLALYVVVALVPALILHEYAHAATADRLGDPTPRRWGRLTLNPKPLIDPFGSLILPALAIILIAGRGAPGGAFLLPVFAYAKPLPHDPSYLRNPRRDGLLVAAAGLVANLLLLVPAGIAIRLGATGEIELFAFAWLIVNAYMFGIQLMPIPGLDGSKLLARFLPPRAREVYVNLEQYLVLFVLLVFFILSGPLFPIVEGFGNLACNLAAGADCLF
jgi:Zn-dependent protease